MPQSCVAATLARFGQLDILVNNAGTNPYFGPMIDIDVARAQKTFEVNQLAVLLWTAAAVKAGLRGSVINVASIGGLGVEPGIGWYNVTKAAVLHITRQLSYELAPDIRVNALAPGLVKTKLAAALWEDGARTGLPPTSRCAGSGLPDDIATAALVPGLRRRLVDHGSDVGRRRWHDGAPLGWGGLRTARSVAEQQDVLLANSPKRHVGARASDPSRPADDPYLAPGRAAIPSISTS